VHDIISKLIDIDMSGYSLIDGAIETI